MSARLRPSAFSMLRAVGSCSVIDIFQLLCIQGKRAHYGERFGLPADCFPFSIPAFPQSPKAERFHRNFFRPASFSAAAPNMKSAA